jgi:hypothetical protein
MRSVADLNVVTRRILVQRSFHFHERREISLVSERLLAFQDGHCSVALITVLVTEIEPTVCHLSHGLER